MIAWWLEQLPTLTSALGAELRDDNDLLMEDLLWDSVRTLAQQEDLCLNRRLTVLQTMIQVCVRVCGR